MLPRHTSIRLIHPRHGPQASVGQSALFACPPLERRMLLSLSPAGAEFRVSTFKTGAGCDWPEAADLALSLFAATLAWQPPTCRLLNGEHAGLLLRALAAQHFVRGAAPLAEVATK